MKKKKSVGIGIFYFFIAILLTTSICFSQTIYYGQGLNYAIEGKFEEAKVEFEKALEVDPHNMPTKLNLQLTKDVINRKIKKETAIVMFTGIGVSEVGGFYEAIKCFSEAIANNPNYASAYSCRGLAYNAEGKYDEAISDFNKALNIDPKDVVAYTNRVDAYDNKGKFELAITDLNKAIEISPESAELYYNIAVIYVKVGRKKEAIESYKNFIEYAPSIYASYIERVKKRIKELEQ